MNSHQDALGNRHGFNYNTDGNFIDETDANGNTAYSYDSLDQRAQTLIVVFSQ
jgi:YD repeat-containing protein